MTPLVVVLSSPSGVGKTTITKTLLNDWPERFGYSVSATTRPPRVGERDGQDYHFLSSDAFARREAAGDFVETADYAGYRYGTLRDEVELVLSSHRNVLLDIEVQGAQQVRRQYPRPASVAIFVLPPSPSVWIDRLMRRRTETDPALVRRLDRAKAELHEVQILARATQPGATFDHIVVNDDLDRVVTEVVQIVNDPWSKPHRPGTPELITLVHGLIDEADRRLEYLKTKESL